MKPDPSTALLQAALTLAEVLRNPSGYTPEARAARERELVRAAERWETAREPSGVGL